MTRNDEFYGEDIKNISRVDFTLYTNKDVKLYSAVRNDPLGITVPESYDNYEPKKGGLVDLRLGTCDIYLPCSTCGLNSEECPGHFGHTELAEPAFHYGFLGHVKNLLQTICLRCSNILVEKDDKLVKRVASKDLKHRFMEIKNITKGIKYCYTCGAPVPVVKKEIKEKAATVKIILEREMGVVPEDQVDKVEVDPKKKLREFLSPRDVYNILKNVSDTDAHLLGFNTKYSRPEDLILTRFPIPPVVIRPTARIDFMSSSTMEDSLTLFIAGIISNNNRVRKQLEKEAMEGDQSTYKQDVATLVQYNIATYFDNETITLPRSEFKTGGKPLKSIKDRISAKTGRVRQNLMGKRVDFSGRTVITSDPNIDIDQVGVPLKIAMELTFPEEVTPTNIKYLTALVKNGRDKYPGANYVIRTVMINGEKVAQKIDLKYRKKDIKLKYGDVVERHMLNDDYVLFNRQPSLHKPSMMGHKAHILNRDDVNTLRVNVSVTAPYNADFDGDEMNIFLAQSIQSRNELARICNSKFQIIHAKDSKPIIGCKQDAVSGAYMMSVLNDKMDEELKNQLIATTSAIHNYKSDNKDDGLSLFSKIIPEGINSTKFKEDGSIDFQIKNGNLMKGVLDKSQLSTAKNSIIHFIWDKYGADYAQKFIDDTQRIVLNYLMYHGQTAGFGDTIINDKAKDNILNILKQNDLKIRSQITQYENDVDKLSKNIIEELILAELSSIGPNISSLVYKELDKNNFLYILVDSGAKGNKTNIQQIMGCLGQQVVEGKRIQPKLNNRTLPYFHQFDDTPDARGFCKNNFLTGLESYEMFFHSMGGREGLIDTAIKSVTWETEIIVLENDKPKKIEIGKWIDTILEENVNLVEHYKDRDMELLELGKINNKSYIPTTDMDGNIKWGEISAITRHDPSEYIYKITTKNNRTVRVVDSKSLLIWDSEMNSLVDVLTSNIKVGDLLPVTAKLIDPPIINNSSIYTADVETLLNLEMDMYSHFDIQYIKARLNIIGDNVIINDIMLDEIVSIEKELAKDKVYDLTIPSTLNFGLANGLQVRDTAKTGYIQRKLIKGMEDMNVTYDSTVRGANGVIVQFTYGDSGIDQARQTEVKIRLISSNNKQVETNYLFNKQQLEMLKKKYKKDYSKMNDKLLKELLERRDLIRRAFQVNMLDYKYMENKYMLPVNLYRLTQDYNNLRDKKTEGDIDPDYVIDQIEHLLISSDIRIFNYNNDFFKEDELNYKYLFKTALLDYLSPKMVLFDMQLNKSEFDNMLNDIKKSFLKALVEPGEMVGIIAAQSIGEPTSQMTLNTKHSAGVAGKGSANMGVGRVEELVHYAKSISTPQMYIYFKNNKFDEGKVKQIASNLNYLNLNMLIEDAEIILDMGDDTYYGKQLKDDNVSNPFFVNNAKAPLETLPFVFRLKLDLEKILDKGTDNLDIKTKFLGYWALNYSNTKGIREKDVKDTIKEINKLAILSNGVDVIHIRFSLNNFDYVLLNKFLNIVLNNISLKGVDSIDNVDVENIIYSYSDEEGNIKQDKEYRLITSGINFDHILKIKDVDTDRTICNDVHYVYQHYGIEAARNIIFSELNNVFKSDVNQAHLNMLVDTMTHLGFIISIDRHGVPKLESEVMAKAAFEMTMDHFVNAALFNEKDNINSVSSRVMTGRVVKGGTGCFDLLMDTSKLEMSELTRDEYGGRVEVEKLELDPVFESMF
jgi:DNA-directed RNA polymerase beta' subunit